MTIRIVCFALMVLVQPYGWYTWIFGISAAVLPYIAVVFANAGSDSTEAGAESPLREIDAPQSVLRETETSAPQVFTIYEDPNER